MDEFYNRAGAANALEKEARERRTLAAENYSPTFQHLADLNLDASSVIEGGACRKNWRLCIPCESDGVLDEVVFGVQGVITNLGLVPIAVGKVDHKRAIKLAQRVEVSGFNTPTFEEALNKLETANDRFSQHFRGQGVQKISPPNGQFGRSIACSNRLFTLRMDNPTEQGTDFEAGIDPLGTLEKLISSEMFHSTDNIVKYYTRGTDLKDGITTFVGGFPGSFKIGDIVEVQASLVSIKTADGGLKLTCRLHALTMLDNSFTKLASSRRMASRKRPVAVAAIRCRVGHFETGVLESKKARMIDEDKRMIEDNVMD
ncbi:hypothetical protein C8F04DRAFT_1187323 [Mycena alexandri]|uniref:Uncharacterized protein n=1 Tax=Mycena alexandri TaxID=1745969 RepID=A0AAD6X024_9AGAR|nr:hypothetical protein C8F04DRAFT_1187323 [Mycena alexandri]